MALNREKIVRTAEKFVARGRLEAAIKEYRKVLAENPNDANTLNRVGDLYARIERFGEAVKLFTQIAEQYTRDGFFVKAIAIYKKIIKLDPTSLPVYERLAELYHRQGLLNEARTQYQVLADYYQKHDNATSAITIYQKMAQMEPENPSFHLKLAELYEARHLNDKALAAYRQLADLLLVNGSVDEATQVYLKALEIADGDSDFVRRAVSGLHDGGHVGAAAQVLARATELDPAAAALAEEIGILEGPTLAEAEPPEAEPPAEESVLEETDETFLIPETSFTDLESLEESAPPPADDAFEPPSFDTGVAEHVFTFDIDDDAVPETLVQPPADMLDQEAPALEEAVEFDLDLNLDLEEEVETEAAAPAAEEEVEIEWSPDQFELPEPEAERPAAATEDTGPRDTGPRDAGPPAAAGFELSLDLEDAELFAEVEPSAPAAEDLAVEVEDLEPAAPAPGAGPPAIRREEDLLAEARVFAKYGLEEKALDRLQELFDLRPDHLEGLELRTRIHLQAGRHEEAIAGAGEVSRIAVASGDLGPWNELRDELLKAGYSLEEDDRISHQPEEKPAEDDRIAQLLEDLSLEDFELPAAGMASSRADAPVAAEMPAEEPPPAAAEEAPAAPPVAPAVDHKLVSLVEELGLEELQDQPQEAAASEPAAPEPEEPAEGPADDTGMSWLDDVTAGEPEAVDQTAALFEEEDDFFDLAAELERELSQDDLQASVVQPQEQSLEDIIEGFKQGVAENLSPEDYETHFNLGIAYREMGLIDEAIGEFQLASKDERYVIDCSSLLGSCFLEKGLPELAVRWFRRGLESPAINEEATLGLLYEMGDAYLSLGDSEAAYKTFVEVYGRNSNYRDVSTKLQELRAS